MERFVHLGTNLSKCTYFQFLHNLVKIIFYYFGTFNMEELVLYFDFHTIGKNWKISTKIF